MKIQSMAVMFIIIILPISMIFASYTGTRVQTLSLQASYDSKLNNATYDAIKAFQLNTINSTTSDLANSKMRDLNAAVNTFFNSVASHFGMSGYDKKALQEYVPALVFTLYDGYYIYSPYANVWDEETIEQANNYGSDTTYHGKKPNESNKETLYGLKPYIYYSCRYKNSSCDIVVTYSLDSYITIKGLVNGQPINEKGYLLTDVSNSSGLRYKGYSIDAEPSTSTWESVLIGDELKTLPYKKVRGVKYYDDNGEKFSVLNGQKQTAPDGIGEILLNDSAKQFYQNAIDFKSRILGNSALMSLRISDAKDENGNSLANVFGSSNDYLFAELSGSSTHSIEDSDSIFNNHRMAVIRYSIERNLSIAIANYNNASGVESEINFQMPKLKDYEWDKIYNNISMISFMQGLNIGGKIYNGYSVISNNKNEEYVAEDSLYVLTTDGIYHRITDGHLQDTNYLMNAKVILNVDFEVKKGELSTGSTFYYYPQEHINGTSIKINGCYQSMVNQTAALEGEISDIVSRTSTLGQLYYLALGRERQGMYRVEE